MSKQPIQRFKELTSELNGFPSETRYDSDYFVTWHNRVGTAIRRELSGATKNRYLVKFANIKFRFNAIGTWGDQAPNQNLAFNKGKTRATALLVSLIEELEQYGPEEPVVSGTKNQVEAIESLVAVCQRFHLAAKPLRSRHANRAPLTIDDEYDLQDVLHAMLLSQFENVRKEDYSPQQAGGGSRIDFVLPDLETVIEVKMTRKGLGDAELGSQLATDIERYRSHPNCKTLLFFVYDPSGCLVNASAIEKDLTRDQGNMSIRTVIYTH